MCVCVCVCGGGGARTLTCKHGAHSGSSARKTDGHTRGAAAQPCSQLAHTIHESQGGADVRDHHRCASTAGVHDVARVRQPDPQGPLRDHRHLHPLVPRAPRGTDNRHGRRAAAPCSTSCPAPTRLAHQQNYVASGLATRGALHHLASHRSSPGQLGCQGNVGCKRAGLHGRVLGTVPKVNPATRPTPSPPPQPPAANGPPTRRRDRHQRRQTPSAAPQASGRARASDLGEGRRPRGARAGD
jgi:hypothetical protein